MIISKLKMTNVSTKVNRNCRNLKLTVSIHGPDDVRHFRQPERALVPFQSLAWLILTFDSSLSRDYGRSCIARPQYGARHPAAMASASLQNHLSPCAMLTLVFAYHGDQGA